MKIGVSSIALSEDVIESISRAKKYGFLSFEIGAFWPHAYYKQINKKIMYLKNEQKRTKLFNTDSSSWRSSISFSFIWYCINFLFYLVWGNIGHFILGLLSIGGGIFLFIEYGKS